MHNVKKSPASEAQLAARNKERDAKLQAFVEARNAIFGKREKGQLDQQLLELTAELLKKNPDFYTMWNIRRDTIAIMTQKENEESDEEHRDRIKSIYDNELKLTFKALEANPKSYSAWYQRAWSLQQHPEPNFKEELAFCEKSLLDFDCRNFHCWDYRRDVAKMAGLDEQEEMEFSDRLLKKNPSNYSAWHYRGSLMQRIQKAKDPSRVLDDQFVTKELETVKNICAYNTEDQTAWTYCRWLCEALCTKVETSPVIVCIDVTDQNSAMLTFSSAISETEARQFIQSDSFELFPISKFRFPSRKTAMVHKWSLKVSDGLANLRVKFNDEYIPISAETSEPRLNADYLQKFYSIGPKYESGDACSTLQGVVEMCEGLIKEDKDIPWQVLMLSRTLPLVEGYTDKTIEQAKQLLEKAIELDPQRRNVYKSMSERLEKTLQCSSNDIKSLYEFFCLNKSLN